MVNCGELGVMASDCAVGLLMVTLADAVTLFKTAVMAVEPGATADARPAALMVSRVVLAEVQVTWAVRSALLPSL